MLEVHCHLLLLLLIVGAPSRIEASSPHRSLYVFQQILSLGAIQYLEVIHG